MKLWKMKKYDTGEKSAVYKPKNGVAAFRDEDFEKVGEDNVLEYRAGQGVVAIHAYWKLYKDTPESKPRDAYFAEVVKRDAEGEEHREYYELSRKRFEWFKNRAILTGFPSYYEYKKGAMVTRDPNYTEKRSYSKDPDVIHKD